MQTQYSDSPAEIYERHFVPALFGQWGEVVADQAGIETGHHVLDVACGTGVLAVASIRRTGERGYVVGLDANPEMLEVAGRKAQTIDWRHGRAESLPFENALFDRVVSQFGFMFFDDRPAALREMLRVLKPDGRLVVAVCDALDHSPGYAVLTELLQRLFGEAVAEAFRAPFSCGDPELLLACAREAGIGGPGQPQARITQHCGQVVFPSVDALVSTERACAWTLGGLLDDAQFERLAREAEITFKPFVTRKGEVAFDMPVLILSAAGPAPQ